MGASPRLRFPATLAGARLAHRQPFGRFFLKLQDDRAVVGVGIRYG